MDYSPLGSSVHGILQARILDGLACPPPGDLPNPGIKPISLMSPALTVGFFTTSTTWETPTSIYTSHLIFLKLSAPFHWRARTESDSQGLDPSRSDTKAYTLKYSSPGLAAMCPIPMPANLSFNLKKLHRNLLVLLADTFYRQTSCH